ncbi:MAG: hypothetical protein ABJP48_10650 [Erythrobacter sp.]
MFRFCAFLLLLSALIVPRVAWGAHEAGHGASIASTEAHVHHDGHTHLEASHDNHSDSDESAADSEAPGLAHDHLAAEVLSAMADVGHGYVGQSDIYKRSLLSPDRRSADAPGTPTSSLLRPPRAA